MSVKQGSGVSAYSFSAIALPSNVSFGGFAPAAPASGAAIEVAVITFQVLTSGEGRISGSIISLYGQVCVFTCVWCITNL